MTESSKDFSSHYDWRDNGIGFLRLMLASLVLFGHAPGLGGYPGLGIMLTGEGLGLGAIAVMGFFTLSGMLITRSWESSKGLKDYFTKRILRIFPGYWMCLIMCAFFFGPLAWHLLGRNGAYPFFAGPDSALGYVLNNFTSKMNQPFIEGLYFSGGQPHGVNFPLWTIISEFGCYVLTGIAGALGISKKHRWWFVGLMLACSLIVLKSVHQTTEVGGLASRLPHLLSYLIGVVVYYFHEKIPLNAIAGWACLVLALLSSFSPFTIALFPFLFGYAIVVAGFKGRVRNIERKADYSYGVYMYGWPVQIILGQILPKSIGVYGYLFVTLLTLMPFAMASWHFVEKPATKLKKRFMKPPNSSAAAN
ncbi:MAG: acyltransferase [Chthonomonas sp.]|nr:acyltransferase [Chthonomonas sp.]